MKLMIIFIAVLMFTENVFAQEKLSLEDCINIALKNSITLEISGNNTEMAKYDKLASYRGVLPTISASAGKGKRIEGAAEFLGAVPVGQDSLGNVIYEQRPQKQKKTERNTNSAGISLSWNLFDGGVSINQIRKSGADLESSSFGYESDRNKLILDIQDAYFNLLKQIKLYEVDKIAVERSRGQLERTQKMYDLGSKAKLDVFQAKVNLGNDKISMLNQKNVKEDARRYLNILMGRSPLYPLEVKPVDENIVQLDKIDDLIKTAEENQPLIKKNQFDLKSQKMSTLISYGVLSPTFSFYYNYNRFHDEFAKVYTDFDLNYSATYGFNLSLNLFNGFSDYVNIQKAKLGEKNAQANLINYTRNLESRIQQYYQNYQSYKEIISINEENLEAAKEELRLAEERYTVGAGTSLDVREAQVKLTRAEETLIAARYNTLITLAQLDNELGITEKKLTN